MENNNPGKQNANISQSATDNEIQSSMLDSNTNQVEELEDRVVDEENE